MHRRGEEPLNIAFARIDRTGDAISQPMPAMMIDLKPRLVVMNAGAVIAEGDVETVLNDREVIEAYLGGAPA